MTQTTEERIIAKLFHHATGFPMGCQPPKLWLESKTLLPLLKCRRRHIPRLSA